MDHANRTARTSASAWPLTALAMLTALGSGCVVDTVSDSAFSLSWEIQYEGGAPSSCGAAGTPIVRVLTDNLNTGQAQDFDLPCARGAGYTDVLPTGSYEVSVQLVNPDGGVLTQRAPELLVISPSGLTQVPHHVFQIRRSAFFLDWSVAFVGEGNPTTCADVGAAKVGVIAQAVGGAAMSFEFPCEDMGGLTPSVPPGPHEISVFLLDAAGVPLSETGAGSLAAVTTGPTDIGFVEFEVQSFVVLWSVEAAGVARTCASVGAASVELTATLSVGAPLVFVFPCEAMNAATTAVPVGTYNISARLLDGAGAPLSQLAPMVFQASELTRARLPMIVFEVNAAP